MLFFKIWLFYMSIDSEQLNEMCKDTFFEVIHARISQTPPDYELLVNLFEEIKTRLSGILKNGSPLRNEIEERMDTKLFGQMMVNDAFSFEDFQSLVSYTFTKCAQLCSPARDVDTDNKFREIVYAQQCGESFASLVVLYIRNIHDCLDWLYTDLHIFLNEGVKE